MAGAVQFGVSQTLIALIILVTTVFILYSGRKLNEMVVNSIITAAQNERLVERLRIEIARAEKARRQTEEESERRSKFFAAANHDIRQPLQAMGIYIDILGRRATPQTVPVVKQLALSISAISTLVEQVLTVTRMEFGQMELHPEHASVRELLEELAEECRPIAEKKGLRLRVSAPPVTILTDVTMVKRALKNLVSNAVAYSDPAKARVPEIVLGARRVESRLVIGVYDCGPGISAEDRSRIFGTFYRGAAGRAAPGSGYGLGLSIVRGIARQLGLELTLGKVISQIIPMPMQRGIASRFEPLPVVKGEIPLPFDYVRASINLIVSAILIASATSLKLPLSTTYVTFMVAMGSSFADGAWDRESAVYRISGVLTVISGWFLTALSASSLAAVVAVLVFWGGEAAAIILGFGAIFLLVRSNLKTREDDVTLSDESRSVYDAAYVGQLLSKHVQKSLSETLRVLSRIHENFTADRERELTKVKASATDVFEDAIEARSVYYRMVAAEAAPSKADFDARYLYLRACTNTREVSRSLQNLAKLARDHVANRHRVGSNEITNDIGTLVADIRTLVNAREDHADVTALRNRAADVITRIEDLQRRLMEAQPRGSMTIRCCEFHLSYLLVLRELVNHYEIASLLEEQIDALARGAKAA